MHGGFDKKLWYVYKSFTQQYCLLCFAENYTKEENEYEIMDQKMAAPVHAI